MALKVAVERLEARKVEADRRHRGTIAAARGEEGAVVAGLEGAQDAKRGGLADVIQDEAFEALDRAFVVPDRVPAGPPLGSQVPKEGGAEGGVV